MQSKSLLLQGDWLEGHMQVGIVTVLSSEQEVQQMKKEGMSRKISILKCPKIWRINENEEKSLTTFQRGM